MRIFRKIVCKIKGHKNNKSYIISKCSRCFKIIENENNCECKKLGVRWDIFRCDLCGKILVPHLPDYYGE